MNINIEAAKLDGYEVRDHGGVYFMHFTNWRRGPFSSEDEAWRFGGIPDYAGSRREALDFAARHEILVQVTGDHTVDVGGLEVALNSPEITKAVIAFLSQPDPVDEPPVEDLAALSYQELRQRASDAGIPGRSGMSKAELIEALCGNT